MITRPKKRPILLSDRQCNVLKSLINRHLTPQQIAKRARVILESEQGLSNSEISRRIPLDRPQVGVWRECWIDEYERLSLIEAEQPDKLEKVMVELLSDAPRPGAPATFTPEQVVQMIAIACEDPKESDRPVSHWTPREIRDEAIKRGIVETISERQVGRFLKSGGLETASL
jgi:putative transposase